MSIHMFVCGTANLALQLCIR